MAETVCPFCKEVIDDDSLFCDLCGNELMKCTSCGGFCKGKFCPRCGSKSVKASEEAGSSASVMKEAHSGPRPTTLPDAEKSSHEESLPTQPFTGPTRMVCREQGITIPLKNGAVIGRVIGDYVIQLSGLKYLSGTHARLDFDGSRWTITDLGSRNGTVVNGVQCTGAPMVLSKGSLINFARSYNFIVE